MDAFTDDQKAMHEELWRKWIHATKLREQATARKVKRFAAVVLGVLVVSGLIYMKFVNEWR